MAWGAPIHHSMGAQGAQTTLSTSGPSHLNIPTGALIVCWLKWEDTPGANPTVIDNGGSNSLTPLTKYSVGASGQQCQWFYKIGAVANADAYFTVTFGATVQYPSMLVAASAPDAGETVTLDGNNITSGSGATATSPQITTTGTDEIVLGGYAEYASGAPSGYLIGGLAADGSEHTEDASYNNTAFWWRILTATMTNGTAVCTCPSHTWAAGIIAFKSAAGAPPPPPLTLTNRKIRPRPFAPGMAR